MITDALSPPANTTHRYESVLRVSEAIVACWRHGCTFAYDTRCAFEELAEESQLGLCLPLGGHEIGSLSLAKGNTFAPDAKREADPGISDVDVGELSHLVQSRASRFQQ